MLEDILSLVRLEKQQTLSHILLWASFINEKEISHQSTDTPYHLPIYNENKNWHIILVEILATLFLCLRSAFYRCGEERHSWIVLSFKMLNFHITKNSAYIVYCRDVYWASFFDTIQYNMYSCDIRYIGWTICLNIFGEKDQKRPRTVMVHL